MTPHLPRPWLRPWLRHAAVLPLLAPAALVPVAAAAPGDAATHGPVHGRADGCRPWTATQVAAGFGTLENLSFDRRGGLLLSEGSSTGPGRIVRLRPSGSTRDVVPEVTSPGGQVVVGRRLYYATGDGFADGVLAEVGVRRGTVSSVDLRTGRVRVEADGLAMPNGLVRLPDGSFLASRDVGLPGRTTRIAPDGTLSVFAPQVTSTNGMAVDVARRRVYLASTFNPTTTISVVDLDHPRRAPRRITLDGLGPANSADDLVLGADGLLYVALNVAGRVVRVDPDTGAACTLASGLPFSSSLRFGAGPGWDHDALYVTSFAGTVTRLDP